MKASDHCIDGTECVSEYGGGSLFKNLNRKNSNNWILGHTTFNKIPKTISQRDIFSP